VFSKKRKVFSENAVSTLFTLKKASCVFKKAQGVFKKRHVFSKSAVSNVLFLKKSCKKFHFVKSSMCV